MRRTEIQIRAQGCEVATWATNHFALRGFDLAVVPGLVVRTCNAPIVRWGEGDTLDAGMLGRCDSVEVSIERERAN
jgi:hypothetical protein